MSPSELEHFVLVYRVDRLLLKVASRCNLACTYCYWFQDPAVMNTPPILSREIELQFLERLEQHVVDMALPRFGISLHGGEPLLFGKKRFAELCLSLKQISLRTQCRFDLSLQTNGMLIDDDWVELLRLFDVTVGISLDGPKKINDTHRISNRGRGSYEQIERGLRKLQDGGLDPGVLAVWSPELNAAETASFFVDDMKVRWFDVLFPDATNDDPVVSVAGFYIELFDLWLTDLHDRGVTVRCAENFVRTVTGRPSSSESLGLTPTTTFSVNTAGEYELLDVLNIVGESYARTGRFVSDTPISEIKNDPKWRNQVHSSVTLCSECRRCTHYTSCGGGYLPWRYSSVRGFDNRSAHCASLSRIFDHVTERVRLIEDALSV